MKLAHKRWLLAALQVILVLLLGAKYAYDRATLPRVWVRVAPYDPDAPLRGRYVSLQIEAVPRGFSPLPEGQSRSWGKATLSVEDAKLIATQSQTGPGHGVVLLEEGNEVRLRLQQPVAFFITEHVPDPSRRPSLRAEVTVPRTGPPRPIRLGVEEGGVITPLQLD